MTEVEWVACTDPEPMLEFLHGQVSDRKLRLFACACCRRVWHHLTSETGRHAVEVAERFADGLAGREELQAAYAATKPAGCGEPDNWDQLCAPRCAAGEEPALAAARVADLRSARAACMDYPFEVCKGIYDAVWVGERREQASLLREIIGNPFRPTPTDPVWVNVKDGRLSRTARSIYLERRFADLPALADHLEEAGCTDRVILTHCREPAEHVRGCWVIDLLLELTVFR